MMTDETQALLQELAVADVVDALARRFEHRTHVLDLVSPGPAKVLFGQAVTVGFMPVRTDLMDEHKHSLGPGIYRALAGEDPAGKVLVMSSGGHPDLSMGGSTKLSRIENLGMAGVLTDGRLRDFDELAEFGPAFYCSGEATRAGGNVIQPYLAATPVSLQGTTVVPGDWVFADSSGAVIIPEGALGEVLPAARELKNMGLNVRQAIKTEDPTQVVAGGSMEA